MATILVIDDIPAVVMSLTIVLESMGHEVSGAPNGARGLELLKTKPFDLVITDIWMPGMKGSEVIRQGRLHAPGTRFLAVTGGDPNHQSALAQSGQADYGADAVLLKPFATEELLVVLATLLDNEVGAAADRRTRITPT
jgi:CheY-like chemotaxis protein